MGIEGNLANRTVDSLMVCCCFSLWHDGKCLRIEFLRALWFAFQLFFVGRLAHLSTIMFQEYEGFWNLNTEGKGSGFLEKPTSLFHIFKES